MNPCLNIVCLYKDDLFHTSRTIILFILKHSAWFVVRYGPLFRTSLVGWPLVISTDPDLSRFILQQEGKLVHSWYTESFDNVVGKQNVLSAKGAMHKCLRNLILNQFGSESLKTRFLTQVEELVLKHLQLWSNCTSVELKEAIASVSFLSFQTLLRYIQVLLTTLIITTLWFNLQMIFGFTAKKLFDYDESRTPEKLRENYAAFLDGLISFPLKIPGTSYWKCLQVKLTIVWSCLYSYRTNFNLKLC